MDQIACPSLFPQAPSTNLQSNKSNQTNSHFPHDSPFGGLVKWGYLQIIVFNLQ